MQMPGVSSGFDKKRRSQPESPDSSGAPAAAHQMTVSLLTGGSDRPYVFGLTMTLLSEWRGSWI